MRIVRPQRSNENTFSMTHVLAKCYSPRQQLLKEGKENLHLNILQMPSTIIVDVGKYLNASLKLFTPLKKIMRLRAYFGCT